MGLVSLVSSIQKTLFGTSEKGIKFHVKIIMQNETSNYLAFRFNLNIILLGE